MKNEYKKRIDDANVYEAAIKTPLEKQINLIPGVLDNGIFAHCKPNKIIIGEG